MLFRSNLPTDLFFGVLFAIVAGIMIFVSFDELLPLSRVDGDHHACVYGAILGMAVMALSLSLFSHGH